jgi:TPP-dependent 2-oxoacid decarboxylase
MAHPFNSPHRAREFATVALAASPASATGETVASYLNRRLRQIGVGHVFCIPGDYVAEYGATLDNPELNAGLVRVHPNNEMCATYAADGYGRTAPHTVGCVVFTYGTGTLNATQAVAGAFAEHVPLVVIGGSPSLAQFRSDRDQGVLYHHMVDGSGTDWRVLSEITALAVRIDNPANAPELIDAALRTCLTASQPVYIELASQTALMPCRAVPAEALRPSPVPVALASQQEACDAVLAHLRAARRLVVVGGSEIARSALQAKFAELLKRLNAPYATSPLGKGVLSELRCDLDFAGVYFGRSSPPALQALMSQADCVLALGVLDTDFNYLGVVTPDYNPATATQLPGPTHLQARNGAVLVGRDLAYWGDVDLASLVDGLLLRLPAGQPLPNAPFPRLEGSPFDPLPGPAWTGDGPITYDSFRSQLQSGYLDGHDEAHYPQLIGDSGFSFLSNISLKCAEGGWVAQLAWAAIGYGVGATAGVTLANRQAGRSRRTLCITGDAAFAQSLNALGTVAQLGLDAVVFVMDNRVYAVEQWLINANAFCDGPKAPPFVPLTQVPQGHIWDYVKLAEGFGGVGFAVQSNAELAAVLQHLKQPAPLNLVTGLPTFTLVAVRLPPKDLPSNARWKMACG